MKVADSPSLCKLYRSTSPRFSNSSVGRSGIVVFGGYTRLVRPLLLLCIAAASTGCIRSKLDARGTDAATVSDASPTTAPAPVNSPFSPRSVRIYPLTRIESDAKGPRVVCYVEFKDAWGDTTKSTGTLIIALYRPVGGVEPGMERQERSWEIDLNDLEKNALLFDPATRTYRLSLRDLPDWLVPGASARLRVSMRAESGVLTDDYRMTP